MSDPRMAPVGSVVAKRCTCGAAPTHNGKQPHPRYRVIGQYPNHWLGPDWDRALYVDYLLERVDTGRRHRTSGLLIRDAYVIVSLPDSEVLVSP